MCVWVHTLAMALAPVQNLAFQRPHEELNTKQVRTTRAFKSNSGAGDPLRLLWHVPAPFFAHVPRWSYGMPERNSCLLPRVPPQLSGLHAHSLAHSLNPAPSKASPGGEGDTVRPRAYCCSQLVTGRISVWGATYLRWALKSWKVGGNEAKMRAVFDNDIFCRWKQGWNMN